MRYLILPLLLAACSTPQITTTASTLAQLAAISGNPTAESIAQQGILICAGTAGLRAVAAPTTTPVSVIGQAAADVAAVCAGLGAVPVALPVGVDPASVPVVVVKAA